MEAWSSITITPWQSFTLKNEWDISTHLYVIFGTMHFCLILQKHVSRHTTYVANNTKVTQMSHGSWTCLNWNHRNRKKKHPVFWERMVTTVEIKVSKYTHVTSTTHYENKMSLSSVITPLLRCSLPAKPWHNLVKCTSQIRHNDLMLKPFQKYGVRLFNHIQPNDGFPCGRNPY